MGAFEINLHYIDGINEDNYNLQHDCLRIPVSSNPLRISREIITYCVSDLPSRFNIQNNSIFPKFTFAELSKHNVTSEQLLLWSAPIDLIENYQSYLDQRSASCSTSLETNIFYNCTFPRFGSLCEYEILHHYQNHLTLYDTINEYYHTFGYYPTNFTCYVHLQCDRGLFPVCLDWTEICNGIIDCLENGIDEAYCWQLETNQCNDDEFQCNNGLCIPISFNQDDINVPDCQDGSDEPFPKLRTRDCNERQPSFECEENLCKIRLWTHNCLKQRATFMLQIFYSMRDTSVSRACFDVFECLMRYPGYYYIFCREICQPLSCLQIIHDECPDMFLIPIVPVFSNQIYIAHTKNDSLVFARGRVASPFICYKGSRYDDHFINHRKVFFKNQTCVRSGLSEIQLTLFYSKSYLYYSSLFDLFNELTEFDMTFNYTSEICNRTNMYQCINSSKCISLHRILDGINNCPKQDDEDITQINETTLTWIFKNHFKCELSNKYIHWSKVQNGECDCNTANDKYICEDEDIHIHFSKKNILFQSICDGRVEMIPVSIEGKNETDETECQQWPCDNIYTRCNHVWNCPHGEDETGCYVYLEFNCSVNYHACVSPVTNQLTCLPTERANDGIIDCLGATDEPSLCKKVHQTMIYPGFYCKHKNDVSCLTYIDLCNNLQECHDNEDEQFCNKNSTNQMALSSICSTFYTGMLSNSERFLCNEIRHKTLENIKYFTLNGFTRAVNHETELQSEAVPSNMNSLRTSNLHKQQQCNRGFELRVWISDKENFTTTACLCPPNHYGNQCQYQNQRVSLTVRFQSLADSWSTLFAIIISLIDDHEEKIVHSFEQLTYISARDCKLKFNIYLLYSTRPKDSTRKYFIHIDIYEKMSLVYRGSLLFPIHFLFLPAQRLAIIAVIPRKNENFPTFSHSQCVHGKCLLYSNNASTAAFCQCNRGWSGRFCNISYTCDCSLDSICLGVSAYRRSICVCPNHKFGPRCLLTTSVCQMNHRLVCLNGGQCVPTDEYKMSNVKFRCICPKGYVGDYCEIMENKITISFDKSIDLSQSIFIHFIEVVQNGSPKRTTTFRNMPLTKSSFTIHWSKPFHLIFVEPRKRMYYLAWIQTTYTQSTSINPVIHLTDHCKHVNEIFNETFGKMHMLRRIKYYHLPCQTHSSNLSCFYDNTQLCLCYDDRHQRLANCFDFDHNMTFNCLGQSVCENNGQCFQDADICPERFACICQPCFYGTLCQFSSGGFGLSLDSIIGYHIQPYTALTDQPNLVKVTFTMTLVFILAGLVNGILSLLTFNKKVICEVGCGIYLLGSSIMTLLITAVFTLKSFILIFAQMKHIINPLFLKLQCSSLDFLLRVGLGMDQWLNACIAVERTCVVIKSTSFDKRRSRFIAKVMILILLIFVVATNIYDPIYRRLIEEENEEEYRLWCIALYPPLVQTINSIFNTVHFLVPFIINGISTIILVVKVSRQRAELLENQTYQQILMQQIRERKHLFISPIVLVILGVPRLIITLVSKCMKSTNDAWLFLIGYFISFLAPMLTFIIFVLPSEFYRKELRTSLTQLRTTIQRQIR